MKTICNFIILVLCLSFSAYAQELQKDFINYQGVASDANGEIIASTAVTIDIALSFGSATATPSYVETHTVTTDALGVFTLQIGDGNPVTGAFNPAAWGTEASFVTVSLDGQEVGTTEMVAVPYAISAGNTQWETNGNDIQNKNSGTVLILTDLEVAGSIIPQTGATITEFSTDTTLGGNSDTALPTERAVKSYVDNAIPVDNTQWIINNGAIENINAGPVRVLTDLEVAGSIIPQTGATITEFSTDTTLGGNSNTALPTERAVKTYIDNAIDDIDSGGASSIDDLTDGKSDADGSSIFLGTDAGANDDGTANGNVGVGLRALNSSTTGIDNTAVGAEALQASTIASRNTAVGQDALFSNTTGGNNTAIGQGTLRSSVGASNNTALGQDALFSNIDGSGNTAVGQASLRTNTAGEDNTAIGKDALFSNTTGDDNTAMGQSSLRENTTGSWNTAIGKDALSSNTTGTRNTAVGNLSMFANTEGANNTALGNAALMDNISGDRNVAIGNFALTNNTAGDDNVAIGQAAMLFNTTGSRNVAVGADALLSNTEGISNTAIGDAALVFNISGGSNTAIGKDALRSNNTGNANTAVGSNALRNNNSLGNTAVGRDALLGNTLGQSNTAFGNDALDSNIDGDFNTAIGDRSLSDLTGGNNNIGIGNNAQVANNSGSNQIRMGNTNINLAEIQVPWTVTSDKRWKDHIRSLPYGLNLISQLRPVDYVRKNNENDTREIGFIAQEVKQTLIALGYNEQGLLSQDDHGFLSIRYNDLIPVLTKAIQEQQNELKALQINSLAQQKSLAELQKQFAAFAENTKTSNTPIATMNNNSKED